jgi:hypothetical protein
MYLLARGMQFQQIKDGALTQLHWYWSQKSQVIKQEKKLLDGLGFNNGPRGRF